MKRLSKRTIASRKNGRRSRGPITPEGKRKSAANSLRHGLCTSKFLSEPYCLEEYESLLRQYTQKFSPATPAECAACKDVALATVNLGRLIGTETKLFNEAQAEIAADSAAGDSPTPERLIAAAFSKLSAGHELALLHRYECRLINIRGKALKILRSRTTDPKDENVSENAVKNEPESEQLLSFHIARH